MTVRTLAGLLIGVLTTLLLIALMMSADLLLSVWERLQDISPWAPPIFAALMVLFAGTSVLLGFRVLRGPVKQQPKAPVVVDAKSLERRIDHAAQRGVVTVEARSELEKLDARKKTSDIYLAMFGAASAGKSSLIGALLPEYEVRAAATLGTTIDITHFQGHRDEQPVVIADVPGFGHQPTHALIKAARDEAIRAHLVIYVATGDLDRYDGEELSQLTDYDKPVVVALNKADHYSAVELEKITTHLSKRHGDTIANIVTVSAGGQQEVVVKNGQGEHRQVRQRPAEVAALWQAIDDQMAREDLQRHRESSSLRLASVKLENAESLARTEVGRELTEKYARRAVIGALAAITPGSDLIIQAALATRFLRELGDLYEIPVKEIEIDRFLSLAGDRLKKTTALILAVTGNAFKAFPGIGTLTGGVIHAAAYGMIFDSLGKSICASLEERKSLDPVWAADHFKHSLDNSVEDSAMTYAKWALKNWRSRPSDER
ncbi:MAG: GTPase [Lysobacterales bacterium]